MIDNLFKNLSEIAPDELYVRLSFKAQMQAWEQSRRHSNPVARNQAYLGQLCWSGFRDWLAERFESDRDLAALYIDKLSSLWEFIPGIPIAFGKTRLLLIPSHRINPTDFIVVQEWVDIPAWVADYYLNVEVNLEAEEENCWMRVGGFVSHLELKRKGEYRESDRSYFLRADRLHRDLTMLWKTTRMQGQKNGVDMSPMSHTSVTASAIKLSPGALNSPRVRLQLPFAKWAALIENETGREKLYWQRVQPPLSHWLQKEKKGVESALKASGWQLYRQVFGRPKFAGAFRRREIASTAIESYVKRIDLEGEAIALKIDLMQDGEGALWILPQLRPFNPSDRTTCLSPGVKLALLDKRGTMVVEVESGRSSNILQLPQPFSNSPGTPFNLQITTRKTSHTEYFTI
ncbi:DUF1822 family protein [Phormidium sp. CCY1219]|uniref:DUF1822 family protein n=1 Tax=Phormidium sp. CCY1219 TaxID=2886104 RepID=UPI002D1F6B73|nr:DUF1822 family protein [Phormidium sp. CCY1219]MEB3831932.1 DUF1822 family protein [Phormidium sp. CCY1219]